VWRNAAKRGAFAHATHIPKLGSLILSNSPECLWKIKKEKIYSFPIKGTAKSQAELKHSEKDRGELNMITDLMRNDLSKVSQTGSVQVDELFGIYPFPRVYQMISTVSSKLRPEADFQETIFATFPMGSMTGAPKISTMKIIEREEDFL
jgi:para-aminobenzoate synthetase component 1